MVLCLFHSFLHVFIIYCCISMYCMAYFSSNTFYIINNISTSVNNVNTILFLSKLAILILMLNNNLLDQVHIFHYTYCENFQIHLRVLIYCFEHMNHNLSLKLLFWSLPIFFIDVNNQHLWRLIYLSYCKNLLFWANIFLKLFSRNHILIWKDSFTEH